MLRPKTSRYNRDATKNHKSGCGPIAQSPQPIAHRRMLTVFRQIGAVPGGGHHTLAYPCIILELPPAPPAAVIGERDAIQRGPAAKLASLGKIRAGAAAFVDVAFGRDDADAFFNKRGLI